MAAHQEFAFLENVPLTEAWENEAHSFTPWLSENLDRLGQTIGVPLKLISVEAKLPTADDQFSADIHALNEEDDSSVLIENQFTPSDHGHLGQIMTYLAGLKAKTVIWIAPRFREAHLAAIKWLNENTTEEYGFFAIQLRVVRIGSSPLVPVFEIEEKPNAWERKVASKSRAERKLSNIGENRQRFWAYFEEDFSESKSDFGGGAGSNRWRRYGDKVLLSYFLAQGQIGIYITTRKNVPVEEVVHLLGEHRTDLQEELGVDFEPNPNGHFLVKTFECDYSNDQEYPAIAAWLAKEITRYAKALQDRGFVVSPKSL